MENGDKTKREESGADNNSQNSQALIDAINMRSMSLITLTSIATLYFIDWAQAVLLPLVVAVLISYALEPLVATINRLRVPRPLAAAVVLILLIGIIAGASIPLKQEAMAMLDKIPVAIEQFQQNEASRPKDGESMMEKAQSAAKKIEATASPDQGNEDASRSGATPVRVVDEPLEIKDYVLQGSPAALVLISQCFSALLLVYFVLAIGSLYRRKIVKISGPSFARMRKAARIMNEFHRSVRQFLFVMFVGAVFVGVLTWLAFLALGVEQAGFWGVLAGVASAVPYLGPFLVLMGTGVAAFIQFGELEMSIIVAGTSLAITSVQGYLLTPWLTSHISSLNAVAIFIGLLFWGWLWGPVGLVVATPILMIVKSLCDHVVNLRPVGELLGK
ncbi:MULTISPECIES: AI-2E family transporter [Marinobacter]|jgi:predicted PurR-regulated permease PerM|uniref:AI-2 transport protein TqsA n=1 Tax=Marinobacter salarius TaxID=1420917 RepID=A0A1W6KC78_9GAMM|nr:MULTISPECIES: AI-2E family transporter [Marinobacter]ARM85040.1 AI-2 transport protein TqsA [Marinobacter salarius]AZR39946.1 AI-2 transport protein TqsA [Marinobacter salarius]KXJ48816.1 MAG: permease [Marinobacter sp. Hex_13]MBJ7299587.1 AI-2E family transporter [Marinobacter salarius]MBL83255.1 AI-2E family transporter [Marinobacter sp.]|tara:strand:- start:2999 stop:4165 length:1167 start_codon:yes stop_codon:yes gene_type:complete